MTDPDFWAQVRKQRDEQQPPAPRDRVLWCLVKREQRAEAVVRVIHGTGIDLRYLWNGDLRARRTATGRGHMRDDLLARGWVDPGSLAWGR